MNMATLADTTPHFEQPNPWREFWDYFSTNKGAVAGLVIVLLVLLMAALAPWIAPYSPNDTNPSVFLTPPAWQAGGSGAHWLGTDAIGRDILSRLIHGAR
ncbi:MAG: dipeptide ABC transporter permease DppC, partial [Rhodoferax sp.]|nr:dipeptide ABC transporter permease DppC [Rhodoferax sp.]